MKKSIILLSVVACHWVSRGSVGSWLDACERELDAVHGFVLMQHGKVLAEGSWRPFDTLNRTHRLYSHSKSFTSTAIGFLVDDGKLDLDERVIDIFPDKAPAGPSDNLKALRVRDLLTMNVGATRTDAENDDRNGDWERAYLANAIDKRPGTEFRYDSGATYLLSAIVERRSGRRLMDFLKERLFDHIGIEKAWSATSPSGTACGGWGMNMTTRELARFGQLFLQNGVWNGKRLLSEEWIALATARQTWSGPIGVTGEDGSDWHQGYGFQFWRCRHGFYRADGANGQLTIVMPQYDAVMSVHAGLSDMQKELNLVWKHIVPMLEREEVADEGTRARCAALSLPTVAGEREGAEACCGQVIAFSKSNPKGLKSVRVDPSREGWTCALETRTGLYAIPVGFGEWKAGSVRFSDKAHESLGAIIGDQATAASGAVQRDGRLKIRIWLTEGPQKIDLELSRTNGVASVRGALVGIGGCKL